MPHEATPSARLPAWKRLVVLGSALLTLVGIFDAIENLPLVSGCAFYAQCDEGSFRKPPSSMGVDIP